MNQPELIIQLQQGEESAFRGIVDEWQDMVFNTAMGIVQNEQDADDITQEAFIQVHQSISSFKGDSKFSTWLYRITVSKALDHEKKRRRKKRFAFVQGLFGRSGEESIEIPNYNHPGVLLENKECANELLKAMKQLPDKQRIAFTLNKLEGQSYQETAEIMNTTLYAVESLMGRAKLNLQKYLREYFHQPD